MGAKAPYICTQCWRGFSCPTAFDAHQDGIDPVTCRDPKDVGLVFNDWRDGAECWSWPPGDYHEEGAA